jgi:hypothetical protein
LVVVTGSLHFVGEAMQELGLASSESERGLNDYGATQALSGIRAVTFDVGGTLIEPWPSVGRVYAEVAARHGVEVAAEAWTVNLPWLGRPGRISITASPTGRNWCGKPSPA